MFKFELQRIVRRLVVLSILGVCLVAMGDTREAQVSAALACPIQQEMDCYDNGGAYFHPIHCACSYFQDIYACEQGGGTWNYHIAQCE